MPGQEIIAQSILRKHSSIDTWFVSRASMNLYRGCFHDCAYCNGRAEKYQIEGDFARNVLAKTNALEVLESELDPRRHRTVLNKSFILLGGGVNDAYQPAERHYRLSRGALELLYRYGHPTLILSRSIFVREDADLIKKLNEKTGVVLGVSFSSVDAVVARHFESSVASPEQRLETLAMFKKAGIPCAMFLLPVIPFISDSSEAIESALRAAKKAGADYVIFGGMTLEQGRQYDHFIKVLSEFQSTLVPEYQKLYARGSSPRQRYLDMINRRFHEAALKVKIPVRMPRRLFQNLLSGNDYIATLLDHIAYMLKLRGINAHYSHAAKKISGSKDPLAEMLDPIGHLEVVFGFDKKLVNLVAEILETGTSRAYENLCGEYID